MFSIVFGAVGAFVFWRNPDEPAAIPLLFITCAAAGSSVPWFLGTSVSDVVHGPQFLLFALLTGPLYMLLWPAGLHLAFVFPYRLRPRPAAVACPGGVPGRVRRLRRAHDRRVAGFADPLGVAGHVAARPACAVVPLLILTLAIFVRSYRRTTDDAAKNRMRWAAFGAVASGVTTLALFWLPELLLGRPILGSSWLGIVALFFPFGLAFGILRYHLFDIDVVINRTLVYGGSRSGSWRATRSSPLG